MRKCRPLSPRMSMSALLQVPGVPRGVVESDDARAGRWLSVRGVSTCSGEDSKLKESWPMPKFQPGNQWSRNGNGAGRPAGSRTKLCKPAA